MKIKKNQQRMGFYEMSMSLPVNIPWKIIAVTPEMMDTECNILL
jgi:hypothetical protein